VARTDASIDCSKELIGVARDVLPYEGYYVEVAGIMKDAIRE
jgi:hypothetical protein